MNFNTIRPSYKRKSTFEIPADSKSIYIPLSRYQSAIPSDLAHFYRVSSKYTPHALIQIWMKSIAIRPSYTRFPTQRALIYLWVATKTRSPSDLAHFYRAASTHTRHTHHQITASSITTRPSYTRFYAHPKNMNFLTPSDWAHFHRVAPAHTRHALHKISSKSNATHQSYTRFPTQRALIYLWVATKTRSPPIELIFTGQIAHIVHMSPSKSHPNPTPFVRVIKWFQLKEHLYTFELPPNRDPPPI